MRQLIAARVCAAAFQLLSGQTTGAPASMNGDCITPQNTPCRTIKARHADWWRRGWGLFNIHRSIIEDPWAYRSDGAIFDRRVFREYGYFVVPFGHDEVSHVSLPHEHKVVTINHLLREYEVRSGVRSGPTPWQQDDTDCSKHLKAFAIAEIAKAGESTIAGIRCVRFTGKRYGKRTTLFLAPSLDCSLMKQTTYEFNSLGLPIHGGEFEVTAITFSEPDASLFGIPKGYRLKPNTLTK